MNTNILLLEAILVHLSSVVDYGGAACSARTRTPIATLRARYSLLMVIETFVAAHLSLMLSSALFVLIFVHQLLNFFIFIHNILVDHLKVEAVGRLLQ